METSTNSHRSNDENGNFDRRAGGHPFSASTAFYANTVRTQKGYILPPAEFKDITNYDKWARIEDEYGRARGSV